MDMRLESLIFYQIYVNSFCDSNGDGIGDIKGVLSKIDYLKALGINAVWLTPFYKSPGKDNGYDISDYYSLNVDMGTTSDIETLIKSLHKNGIFVIVDLVANHTSTAHPWFENSRQKKGKYKDYYFWYKTPPNDWKSVFGGSAWAYDEVRNEYYLHSFATEQADVNWDNENVRKEFEKVVDFWLKKGADGFRCDVLDMIAKDFEEGKNGNGEHLHAYIKGLFHRKGVKCFTVGECWSADINLAKDLTHPSKNALTTLFSFWHLCLEKGRFAKGKPTLYQMLSRLSTWQTQTLKEGLTPTVFFENHDLPRSVSRFCDDKKYRYESATLLGAMLLTHYGIPFLFQGEEIGLTNSWHDTIDGYPDVESVGFYFSKKTKLLKGERLKRIYFGGRDNGRRMMPWTEKKQKSWLAPYDRQREINVKKDADSQKSVFRFYQALVSLRKQEKCLTQGAYVCTRMTKNAYVFTRESDGEKITVACAFEKGATLPEIEGEIILSNYEKTGSRFQPYQVVLYKQIL